MKSRILAVMIAVTLFISVGSVYAAGDGVTNQNSYVAYDSYKEIPGLTKAQIAAAEEVLRTNDSFVYGMMESSECFLDESGRVGGYSTLVCDWLSRLFGVPFEPKMLTWDALSEGMRTGTVDFSGDYAPIDSSGQHYWMTSAISEREIKYATLDSNYLPEEIVEHRPLHIAFLKGNAAKTLMEPYLETNFTDNYTVEDVSTRKEAAEKLRDGSIDIFIADGIVLDIFHAEKDIEINSFSHLAYKKVSITTTQEALRPIIDVIDEYLDEGALYHFNELYAMGYNDYRCHAFKKSLNPTELAYYEKHINEGLPIPIGINPNNYPLDFYDEATKTWDGLSIEILEDISDFTGLRFEAVNQPTEGWDVIYQDLEDGTLPMLTGMVYTEERANRFLWSSEPFANDRYALVSTIEHDNLNTNQVLFSRVGVINDTAYMKMFTDWFPDHKGTIVYDSQVAGFDALDKGEIDLLMTTQNHFSYVTNYLQRTNFKLNIVFEYVAEHYFSFNKYQTALASIISKAEDLVNTQDIASVWEHRTFDYQRKINQTQTFFLLGVSFLMLIVIVLLFLIASRRQREGARLQALVNARTAELAEQVAETESASEAKSSFLANMSHEMRTPLNAIIGLSELTLGMEEQCKSATCAPNLEKIYRSGITLLNTVNDILDISKIESGKFDLIPVRYDIPSLINDVVTLNIIRIGEKPINFHLRIDGDFPNELFGDELRVKQIFNNLLSNAFKYTKEGDVTWEMKWEREGDDVWLIGSVTDSGIGIRPEDIKRLFSDYNQVDVKANRKIEGTGLGLSITKMLVGLMDGNIEVTSEYGKGSTFTVRLRQGFQTEDCIGDTVAANLQKFSYSDSKRDSNAKMVRIRLPYARVLIVDDVETNLDVAKGMMKPYGMEIDCVTSGEAAINIMRKEEKHYDAIFMDHMMPEMDGVEATQIIHNEIGTEYAKNIPIIALTANAIVGNEEKFLEQGFQAFLSKPIEIARLDSVIRQWVRNKEKEKEYLEKEEQVKLDGETVINLRSGTDRRSGIDRRKSGRQAGGNESAVPSPAENPLGALADRYQIEGLDLKAGLNRFGGDEEVLLDVLKSYRVNTEPLLEQVREVNADGLDDYAITVHGIKGSSRGVCAESVGDKAEELEHAAKAGNLDFVKEHHAAFLAEAERLIQDIDVLLRDLNDKDAKPNKESPDPDVLNRLKEACEAYDMDGIDTAMSELSRYQYTRGDDLVAWLAEQIAQMDLQSIGEKIRDWR